MLGYVMAAIALLVISPLLVVTPYTFLRDDELEPFRGNALYIRASTCALAYAILWGAFTLAVARLDHVGRLLDLGLHCRASLRRGDLGRRNVVGT